MWAYVAKQKRAQQTRDADPFPLQDTLQHMMAVYTCSAPPGTPHTRAQVAGSEALLDALPLPTPQHHQVLLARLTPINTELLSRMRDGAAAGPTDQLPPELLKYAGPAMPPALATLQADMACARHVPLAATDDLMTYI
jgi:hypothetical protein